MRKEDSLRKMNSVGYFLFLLWQKYSYVNNYNNLLLTIVCGAQYNVIHKVEIIL